MSKPQPWVKFEKSGENTGRFVVAPLERGMGTTLGNALRRVLLSALSGYAVTSIQIDGVQHEFSTIPGVVEDVIDIISNIKSIIFSGTLDNPVTLTLEFKKGSVTAGQIKLSDGLQVLNPDVHIAEVTEANKITMTMVVEKGVGYSPSEAQAKADQPIDTINLDASFSPIIRVNHQVEHIRVGKELDYDSLNLEVITNGSISPEDAVQISSSTLIERFSLFQTLNQKPASDSEVSVLTSGTTSSEKTKDSVLNLSIDDLELSARSSNCLKRAGIETVSELVDKDISDLIQIKNFGKKSADEINAKLCQYGLSLKGTEVL